MKSLNRKDQRGAGGSSGGIGQFLLGIVMMCGGFYLLLNSIIVSTHFGFGYPLYRAGRFGITSGMVMIPFLFGVGVIFYDSKKWSGWLLAGGSLVALVFGVISSIQFRFRAMSVFDLIIILILCMGGLGLFLRSLRGVQPNNN